MRTASSSRDLTGSRAFPPPRRPPPSSRTCGRRGCSPRASPTRTATRSAGAARSSGSPPGSNVEVIGAQDELRQRAVEGWGEFDGHSPHRPWVDAVKIRCSKCNAVVSRIPDVGNPWLDAGIVPFSTLTDPETGQVSYLTDKRYWREWYPADFITEAFP